jgi:hypothetical protein
VRAWGALGIAAAYAAAVGVFHVIPRYDAVLFIVVAWAVMRLLRDVRGVWLFAWLACVCGVLALGVVMHQWTTGHEGRTAIVFGIYPYSDAGGFYSDTQRLIAGLPFEVAARRPMHGAYTTAMLRLLGDDLRSVIVVQAVTMAVATAFLTSEIRRAAGEKAALVMLVIGCFFVRRFAGFVATEALGYPLGALGFAFFVRGAMRRLEYLADAEKAPEHPDAGLASFRRNERIVAIFSGALSLSLALVTRAGPMFVVPALGMWVALSGTRRERIEAVLATMAGALLAIAMNSILASHVSNGASFVDLPPILYGALHRDDFTRIWIDHPEITTLGNAQRYDAMMRIVLHDALAHPSLVLMSVATSLSSFLAAPTGLFSFVWNTPDDHVFEGPASPARWARELGPYGVVNVIAMGALGLLFVLSFVAGLVHAWRARRREPVAGIVLFVALGAIASIPFTPPWITASVQVDAAILPFLALVSGLAFGGAKPETGPAPTQRAPSIVLAVTAFAAVFGVVWVIARPELPPASKTCSTTTLFARADPRTRLVVAEHGGGASMDTLAKNVFFLRKHNESFVAALQAEVRPGRAMVLVYDACSGRARLAIGDDARIPGDRAWRALSFRETADPYVVVIE